MSPEVCLHFAAVFLSYILRVAVAYLACWMLNRLLRKPHQRFVVWMIFLLGSGAYWLELIFGELSAFRAIKAEGVAGLAQGTAHSLHVPLAWSHQILLAVQ